MSTRPVRSSSAMATLERAVGQYPDGTPEEALAYFERKYTELAGQVTLLEQRAKRGAPAQDVAKAVAHLSENLTEPNAVGDLEALRTRIEALGGAVTELTEKQHEEAKAAVAAALAERETLVAEIEALALAGSRQGAVEAGLGHASTSCSRAGSSSRPTDRGCPSGTLTSCGSASVPRARPSTVTAARSTRSSTVCTRRPAARSRHSSTRLRRSWARAPTASPPTATCSTSWKTGGSRRQEGRRRPLGEVQGRRGRAVLGEGRDRRQGQRRVRGEPRGEARAAHRGGEAPHRDRPGQGEGEPCAPSRTAGTRRARCRASRCGSSRTACARSRPPCASSTRTTGSATNPERQERSEGFLGQAQRLDLQARARARGGQDRRRPEEDRRRPGCARRAEELARRHQPVRSSPQDRLSTDRHRSPIERHRSHHHGTMPRLGPVLTAHDLPVPELMASRLDGELAMLDGAWTPVDEIEQPRHRALSLALRLPDRVIIEQRSAAWVWGALPTAPQQHQLCAATGARVRPGEGWPAVREVVIAERRDLDDRSRPRHLPDPHDRRSGEVRGPLRRRAPRCDARPRSSSAGCRSTTASRPWTGAATCRASAAPARGSGRWGRRAGRAMPS